MYYYKINYTIGSLLTLAVTLLLGSLIFIRGRRGKIVRSYFLLMLSIAAFSLSIFMMLGNGSAKFTLYWARLSQVALAFLSVFYFHFALRLINLESKQKVLVRTAYLSAIIVSGLSFTPFLVKSITEQFGLNWFAVNKSYPAFIAYFLIWPLYAHYLAYKAYGSLTQLGRRQLRYITIAGGSGFLGGGVMFFTVYGIDVPLIGPLAFYFIAAANLFVAVATYTVQLMDVEIIRRRTLIFSLLYGAAVGLFVAIVFAGQKLLSMHLHINKWVLPVCALFVITIFIRPLENWLAKLTDKVLYQRQYDYMNTLKSVAKGMNLVADTEKLLKLMVRFVSKEVRVTGCAVYIFNKRAGGYIREVTRGFKDADAVDNIDHESSFVQWLKEKREPLGYENLLSWIQGEKLFPQSQKLILKRTLEQIRVTMHRLGGALCVPSFLRDEMIGFLVLGEKLSGDRYTTDDMSLLSTLANNAAIALENARMYEELKQRIDKLDRLYKEEHSLFIDAASAFSYAIDTKDNYTHGHALNVSELSTAMTNELKKLLPYVNFNTEFYDRLKIASLLHDVGKIGVSDKILKKKGKLTKKEELEMRKHAEIGEAILSPIKEIEEVFELIRHHHEGFDGTGYPDGLRGNEIPMISRIICVANAYDTMVSDRPHRKALKSDQALKIIKDSAGKQFDPVITKALAQAVEKTRGLVKA